MVYSNVQAQDADYHYMIAQATKAPSGHNTQPWLFEIKENEVIIRPNLRYRLRVVDPDEREMFVSLGCAAENLCLAATEKGYQSHVSVTAEGVISIRLEKQTALVSDPLAAQIPVRQTTRARYNGQLIAPETIAILQSTDCDPAVGVHFFQRGTAEFDTIAQYVYKGNDVQMNDTAFMNELKQWMRYNKKDSQRSRDGLSYAVFGAPNLPRFIAKTIISKSINAKSQNKNDSQCIASSSHFLLFTTRHNTPQEWVNLGRTLERLLLHATAFGIRNAFLNQPNEVGGLAEKMAESLHLHGETPTILIRLGYARPRPYSIRRPLSEVLLPR